MTRHAWAVATAAVVMLLAARLVDATVIPTASPTAGPSLTPTVIPTVTVEPTTERYRLSHISWKDIGVLASLEAWLFLALLAMFEALRHLKNLYSPRQTRQATKRDHVGLRKQSTVPERPLGLLKWLKPVIEVNGAEVAELVGLDAYMLLRVIRLCTRITLFSSVLGCIVLLPLYASGSGDYSGFNRITLNNLNSDSQLPEFWVPVVINVLFTLHIYHLLDNEYSKFQKWHLQFLSDSRSDIRHQAACTVLVEGIPVELRSNVALKEYLEIIFPQQVVGVRVQVSVAELEALHAARLAVVDKLERAVRLAAITQTQSEIVVDGGCMREGRRVEPVAYYEAQLAELNATVQELQDKILADRRAEEEASAQRLEGVMATVRESFFADSPQAPPQADSPMYNPLRSGSSTVSGDVSLNADGKTDGAIPTAMDFVKDAMINTADETLSVTRTVATNLAGEVTSGVTAQIDMGKRAAASLLDTVQTVTVGRRMSNVAFVTMRNEFWATMLSHGPHLTTRQIPGPNPFGLKLLAVSPAPDPREIIWKNVTLTRNTTKLRRTFATFGWALFAVLWSSVIVVVTAFGTSSAITRYVGLRDHGHWATLMHQYLPSILQLGLLALIPVVVQFVAIRYEGYRSQTEVQAIILSRYFMFQIANIFLTVSAGSFASYIRTILHHPNDLAQKLAEAFPTVGAYFIEFIIIKLFFGLFWELSRFWPATQYLFAHFFSDKRKWTERSLKNAFATYPSFLYGWVYPSILGVIVIEFLYSVITPMVSVFAFLFFLVAEIVFKNQALYVYIAKSESGGLLWHLVFDRIMGGLVFSHVVLFAYIYLISKDYLLPTFISLLLCCDFIFWTRCKAAYTSTSGAIPLELAVEKDRQRHLSRRQSGLEFSAEFDLELYEQPALVREPVMPIPYNPAVSAHDVATQHTFIDSEDGRPLEIETFETDGESTEGKSAADVPA